MGRPKTGRAHGLSAYDAGCRCEVCRTTHNAYMRERRANDPAARESHNRNGRLAGKARLILVKRHREEYLAILAEVREAADAAKPDEPREIAPSGSIGGKA